MTQSLVMVDFARGDARYHLLEATRQYALEKLAERGERQPLAHRHALAFLDVAELSIATGTPSRTVVGSEKPRPKSITFALPCATRWASKTMCARGGSSPRQPPAYGTRRRRLKGVATSGPPSTAATRPRPTTSSHDSSLPTRC